MTAADLYRLEKWERESLKALKGCYYDHLPELKADPHEIPDTMERVGIRVVAEEWEDHRRFHRVATVWYDEIGLGTHLAPVMVITNGGREGDDHHNRFVTDRRLLTAMAQYMTSQIPVVVRDGDRDHFVELDQDVKEMTRFYNWDAFRSPNYRRI